MATTKKTRRMVGLWRTHDGSQEVRLYLIGEDNTAPQFCWEAGTVYPYDERAIADTTPLAASSIEEAVVKCRTHLMEKNVIPNTNVGKTYVSPRVVQLLPRLKDEDRCALLQPVVGRVRLFRPDVPVRVARVEPVMAEVELGEAPVAVEGTESAKPQAELFV
jgi:hypothetical protein